MISVRIYGCKDIKLKADLRNCIDFCIKKIMPRKRKLNVKVFLDPKYLKEEGMLGSCQPEDSAINRRHYDFAIHLDANMKFKTMISILAHEMAHVKQFATGELLYTRNHEVSIWKGVKYSDHDVPYNDRPEEKDAVEFEISLRHEWLTQRKANIL
jgi:hypothetical protein